MKVDFPEELKRQICIADEPIVNKVLGFVAGSDKASTRAEKAARLIGGQHNRLETQKSFRQTQRFLLTSKSMMDISKALDI